MLALLLLLRVGMGSDVYVDHCEMIELNTLHTRAGGEIEQAIFWGWGHPLRREELVVYEYKVTPLSEFGYSHARGKYYCRFTVEKRGARYPVVVWANTLARTHCHQDDDPELANREVVAANRRRGLFPELSVLLRKKIKPR